MFEIGVAKSAIHWDASPVGMLGYAQHAQTVQGQRTELFVRAFAIRNEAGHRICLVSAELCWITQAVRQEVLARLASTYPHLELNEHNLLLSATHTHSAPGGFSHHFLYNLSVGGFVPKFFDSICDATLQAITEAFGKLQPGTVGHAKMEIPSHEPVAFNRSIEAYNANPDVTPMAPRHRNRAVNRRMTLLRFDSAAGRPLGAISWFGVHATSIDSDNREIDSDNKGYAARTFEQIMRKRHHCNDFVGAFAQTTPGDVSPNFRWDPQRRLHVGPTDSAEANARINGEIQCRYAMKLFRKARLTPMTDPRLWSRIRYEDHGKAPVDPRYTFGRSAPRTRRAMFGISMAMGTTDGRGPLFGLRPVVRAINGLAKKRSPLPWAEDRDDGRGAQFPFLDLSRGNGGRMLALFSQARPPIPGWIYPPLGRIQELSGIDADLHHPWAPEVVPVQLCLIGNLAIAGLPGEPTTVAGRRLGHSVHQALRASGIDEVLVAGYCNAYSSYITTYHEYQQQAYEGGCTLFGPWTLAAYQTRFDRLAKALVSSPTTKASDTGASPYVAPERCMKARSFASEGEAVQRGRTIRTIPLPAASSATGT